MTIFIVTFVLLLCVVAAMSIGVIFQNKPIKGSCGGMSAVGIDAACEICGGNPSKCEEYNNESKSEENENAAFYDASKKTQVKNN